MEKMRSMTDRNWLTLALVLMFAFGIFISPSAARGVLYALLLPWSFIIIYRDRVSDGIPREGAARWGIAAAAMSVLSALATMTVEWEWGVTVGVTYVCWLLLLNPRRDHTPEQAGCELFSIGACMVTLYVPFALTAMLSVFTGNTMSLPGISSLIGIQDAGDFGGRLYIMAHPNITARYAVLNVMFCLYALYTRRGALLRGWFGLNLVLNLLVLVHTQSRTCYIALAAGLGIIALRGICLKLGGKLKGFAAGAAAAALVFFLVLQMFNGIYEVDVKAARAMAGAQENAVVSHVEKQGQFDVASNGRDKIWNLTFTYLKNHPQNLILGMGEGDLAQEISEELPQMDAYEHLHNSLVAVLMHYGLPCLLCVLGFLCMMIKPSWRMFMRRENGAEKGLFIVPVCVAMLLLMSLTEEMLFTRKCYSNIMFFFFCGLILRHGGEKKEING